MMSQTYIDVRASYRGFSLAEAMLVLAFLIVVAAVSLPLLFRSTSFIKLRADAFAIAGKLTQAKFRAANELTAYRVSFDPASNSYLLERHTGDTFTADEPAISLSSSVSYASEADLAGFTSVPTDDEQRSPATQSPFIAFNSRGIPVDLAGQPLPDNAIYLRNENKDYFAVTVSLAGLVEVWRCLPDGKWVAPQ